MRKRRISAFRYVFLLPFLFSTLAPLTPASANDARSAPIESWPVFSMQTLPAEGSGPTLSISVVMVPEEAEKAFVTKLVRASVEKNADPLLLVKSENDKAIAEELSSSLNAKSGLTVHTIRPGESLDVGLNGEVRESNSEAKRKIAAEFSTDGVKRAGAWVAVGATGIFSTMFYVTSSVGPATGAALIAAGLQVLSNVYPQVFWRYLNAAGQIGQSTLGRVLPPQNHIAYETGKMAGALIYNFVTTSAFKFVLNSGNAAATFGSTAALADIAVTAAFGMYSSTTWDLAFSKWLGRAGYSEKTVRMMNYGRQFFGAAVSPFMFIPATQPMAMVVLGSFGTLGIVASFYDRPFVRTAERIIGSMEKSVVIDTALAGILNLQNRVSDLFRTPRSQIAIRSCRDVFLRR